MRRAVTNGVPAVFLLVAACSVGDREGFAPMSYAPPPASAGATTSLPRGPQPSFGKTVSLSDKPPPISGGTLVVSRDGKRAVAADPDRDRVFIVNLLTSKLESEIVLEKNDEPGRVVEDGEGRFHVVLRTGGAIVTITIAADGTSQQSARRDVCSSPRGIAFDSARGGSMQDRLIIACEGGELMTMAPASGDATLLAKLEPDLRDIVVTRTRLFVSTFRSARIIELGPDGTIFGATRIPAPRTFSQTPTTPGQPMLAFRMIAAPPTPNNGDTDADPITVHEVARMAPLSTAPGGYYGGEDVVDPCSTGNTVVQSVVSKGVSGGSIYLPAAAVLPVDVATDGETLAVIAAGNGHTPSLPRLYTILSPPRTNKWWLPCTADGGGHFYPTEGLDGQPVAVAFRRTNALIVQSREPAELVLVPEGKHISLSKENREDTGHAIFHSNAGVGAACASCHPEGGDDGHVWTFNPGTSRQHEYQRRTPSLRGTLAGTAPFHWDGEIADIAKLADDVLSGRMSGPHLDAPQKTALEGWLFSIPPPKPFVPADDPAAVRGRALFERKDVMCTNCHAGPHLTTSMNVNVGTGGTFQVPSLIGVGARTPLMHTGCAATIRDRFSPACGGTNHGVTSHLSGDDIDDLTAYLQTL